MWGICLVFLILYSIENAGRRLTHTNCPSRFGSIPAISRDPKVKKGVEESVELVARHLAKGTPIYGVNTGVGASGATRTGAVKSLQKALVQVHHSTVLTATELGRDFRPLRELDSHALPSKIVRGMMLVRANSLFRGHSGVRWEVIEAIMALIARNITPIVPLRGSVSASGDLNPLAYICGAIEGNSDIYVRVGDTSSSQILSADIALKEAGLEPVDFGPKEALGLLNGTAASCSAASFAIFQARQLATLAQVLTAMGTEALQGSRPNYHPFIASVRPHAGQKQAAANMYAFLEGSKLVTDHNSKKEGMYQDRYPLRTASQWIGPQLEDLTLAIEQIRIELNSSTDNPLTDIENDLVHHGGNFQAESLTSAMNKTLSAVQAFGRLLFAQCSELLNSQQNKALPPNLCADEPSTSLTFMGVDINMASYMSELAHISHPVGPYVQSAEGHNEAINSLALIAARNALRAIDILSLMASAHLYALCQALDLRSRQQDFLQRAERKSLALFHDNLGGSFGDSANAEAVHLSSVWPRIKGKWLSLSAADTRKRGEMTAFETVATLIEQVQELPAAEDAESSQKLYIAVQAYKRSLADMLNEEYDGAKNSFLQTQSTPEYLGSATKILYHFVRKELNIPMHTGLREHPTVTADEVGELGDQKTIGTRISSIYESLQDGRMYRPLMDIVGALK